MPVESYSMLIDGQWRGAGDGSTFRCTSPVTGKVWAEVPSATAGDVDAAVVAARRAFEEGPWAGSSPLVRAGLLRRLGDNTNFGLAGGVWTRDVALPHRMIRRLRAGTVWINNYRKVNYVAPFGGFKESGVGREHGVHALDEYTEVKTAWIDTGNVIKDPFNPRA